ncbi:MAG TPA: protein kinase [Polyangiaceae bacterium]|nr:protein kinase [Polyangiaceae bacterium]
MHGRDGVTDRNTRDVPRHSQSFRPRESRKGFVADRYRVIAPLGSGGMASVWSVEDQVSGRKLALKRLSETANPRHVALFEREYHTLASLHHPCIVEAYDYAADAQGPFYTMELLDGSDVSKLAPKPWADACRILRDVASGLALLHARRLIHRDLSARNIWLTQQGDVKVIDFGTMASFGKAPDIAGTPPFIAPESLHGGFLDQRADLYSLGALAYFLFTGRQAFPARTLAELPGLWKERPRPVSRRVSELGRQDLPDLPRPLEALIESLLSVDPLARPTNAADVIDRLTIIAELPPSELGHVVASYLGRPAFVGRTSERRTLRAAFDRAAQGRGASVVIESPRGLGRSRLLSEVSLEARLAGAVVLSAESHSDAATHELAQKYAFALLDAVPSALTAAAPYASTLAHLSSALRERLGVPVEGLAPMPAAHGEGRMRVQAALRDWFADVVREHHVVIVADDFETFDEASAAWLAALSRVTDQRKLLILAATCTDRAPFSIAVQALGQGSTRVALGALSQTEMTELFRSVFGDVQYLARLVDLLQQRTEGNPSHAMDLAEHLTQNGTIAFVEGTWVLPQSVESANLPANRFQAETARFARLSPHARELAQTLSVREGPIPLEMCVELAEIEGHLLFDGLEALVREGILAASLEGYRFSRESFRSALRGELPDARRKRAHLRLGKWLLASPGISELERLRAGVHLLLGGDEEGGSAVAAKAGQHYALVDLADVGPAAPALEVALDHFERARRPAHEIISVLSPLALAGYYADKRLAVRYGERAVDALESVVGLRTARLLGRFLGRKLGLLLALGAAAAKFATRSKNPRVPKFRDALMMLFNCIACLTGVATICIDPKLGKKYASVLAPMTALGPDHVATFMHRFCLNLVATVEDRVGVARAQWIEMLERLDRPNAVQGLPENVYALYLAGALYARGVAECWRDDSQAPACAERLDQLKLKQYDMSADQVRMMYHANRGNLELFNKYRERVEVHAIQRGTAWQVETWTFSGLVTVFVRTRDTVGLKDCVEQLKRMSADTPSLRFAYNRALAAYYVLRGTPSEALPLLGKDEEPMAVVGWSRGEALRGAAYNALGRHAEARDTCRAALERLSPEDLKFCALNLSLPLELSRAEAALGDVATAERRLESLCEEYEAGANPLTMGTLHEALAELAVMRADQDAMKRHLGRVDHWFRQTRDPALVSRIERLSRLLAVVARPSGNGEAADAPPPRMMTIVHRLRHGGDHTRTGSAEWALKQLSEFTEVRESYLFAAQGDDVACVAHVGPLADEEALARTVRERLTAIMAFSTDIPTQVTDGADDPTLLVMGDKAYRLIVLSRGAEDEFMGALLVPDGTAIPQVLLQTIAERLAATEQRSVVDS